MLILGAAHLRAVLAEYQAHYDTARPHQGIAQHVPDDDCDAPRVTVTDLYHRTARSKVRSQRPDQRIHAHRLTPENPQVTGRIPFSSRQHLCPGARRASAFWRLAATTAQHEHREDDEDDDQNDEEHGLGSLG